MSDGAHGSNVKKCTCMLLLAGCITFSLFPEIRGRDHKAEVEKVLTFISQKIGESFNTSGDMDNFQIQLKDGVKLCK